MQNHPNIVANSQNHDGATLMKRATYFSVAVALCLIVIKFYAWAQTGSVSLMSSLVDSSLDMIISLLNLAAVRYALMPADDDHRYGHNSAEDVAALAQAAFVAGSAVFISIVAVGRFLSPASMMHSDVGIVVMLISIVMTLALVMYQKYVVKCTGSTAIEADSLHYVGDLLMNVAVIVALIVSVRYQWEYADPVFALLIAGYIIYGAWGIGTLAFDKLMDKEFEDDEKDRLMKLILGHDGVLGMHDLKTRYSGTKPFIQFHLELDGSQSLTDAHRITDGLEMLLEKEYPGGEVLIHEDPQGFTRSQS